MSAENVIPGFANLTEQECFDMSARHILTTRQKAVDGAGDCTYDGIGCAAAPFLTPAARAKLHGAWHVLAGEGEVPANNIDLICRLQGCHDGTFGENFMEGWARKMRGEAAQNNLSTEVLDKAGV